MIYAHFSFHNLHNEAITAWSTRFEQRFDSVREEEDGGGTAVEEEGESSCCTRVRAEEDGPEVARSRGEESNGVAWEGNGER